MWPESSSANSANLVNKCVNSVATNFFYIGIALLAHPGRRRQRG